MVRKIEAPGGSAAGAVVAPPGVRLDSLSPGARERESASSTSGEGEPRMESAEAVELVSKVTQALPMGEAAGVRRGRVARGGMGCVQSVAAHPQAHFQDTVVEMPALAPPLSAASAAKPAAEGTVRVAYSAPPPTAGTEGGEGVEGGKARLAAAQRSLRVNTEPRGSVGKAGGAKR